ncbi:MAG: hypothetical protein M3362_22165 [Acidobacteriota bacterium]|nr:hypothetical protein [Acidobacteriota bacterium]
MERRIKITRSTGATIGLAIGAVITLGISILLFVKIAGGQFRLGLATIWGIAAALLLLATWFLLLGVVSANLAACPSCGARLSQLSAKSNDGILCRRCWAYLEGSDGMLWRTDENRVADKPIFCSPLPESPIFPVRCCVCGRAEVHLEKISSLLGTSSRAFPSNRWVSADVPHCAEHEGGAQLGGDQDDPYIKFRSLSYLRAFCQKNNTKPGHYRRVKG